MRRHLLTITVLTAATTLALAQTSQTPIAHWMMGGNAVDSSGNGNHGTMNNLTPDTGRNGKANSALFFNGLGNSYISVPTNSLFNTPEFTICATVKVKEFYSGACQTSIIFQRGDFFSSGSYGMIVYDNAYDFSCSNFDSTKQVFAGDISTNTNSANEHYWQHTPTVEKSKWYSVVETYDGSLARIYINGIQKSAIPIYLPIGSASSTIAIGMNRFGNYAQYPYSFTGTIDDISLYNRVLSLEEIKAYDSSTMPPQVVVPTSISTLNKQENTLSLSPQPAHDETVLVFGRSVQSGGLAIYNTIGQVVRTDKFSGDKMKLDLRGWPLGNYMIYVMADGVALRHRLIIE